jgi:hypothetical protein
MMVAIALSKMVLTGTSKYAGGEPYVRPGSKIMFLKPPLRNGGYALAVYREQVHE